MHRNRRLMALAAGMAIAALAPLQAQTVGAQGVEGGVNAWRGGNYDEAIRAWRPLADAGNPDAQFNLAQAYKLGRGVPLNMNLAEQWYERAARQGHAEAGANLGLILFQNGRRREAMPYIERAATNGDPRAQYVFGTALFNGDIVARDNGRAWAFMSRAAATGLPPAVSQLREMEAHVTPEDRARGAELAAALERTSPSATAEAEVPSPAAAQPPRIHTAEIPPSTSSAVAPPVPAPAATAPARPTPPPARTAAPASLASANGRWRVQLGAFSNEANARRAWGGISARLSGLQPSYVPAGNMVRLQAGPLASRAAAERACTAARQACFPVAP